MKRPSSVLEDLLYGLIQVCLNLVERYVPRVLKIPYESWTSVATAIAGVKKSPFDFFGNSSQSPCGIRLLCLVLMVTARARVRTLDVGLSRMQRVGLSIHSAFVIFIFLGSLRRGNAIPTFHLFHGVYIKSTCRLRRIDLLSCRRRFHLYAKFCI